MSLLLGLVLGYSSGVDAQPDCAFAGLDPELDIKRIADDNYYQRTQEVHGDDAFLRRWAGRLCTQQYVALLKGDHPWECALIEQFDKAEKTLFNLKSACNLKRPSVENPFNLLDVSNCKQASNCNN